MRFSTDLNKLSEKIEKEKRYRKEQIDPAFEEEKLIIPEKKEKVEVNRIESDLELKFLKKLLKMIQDGATGFDIAFEIEKRQVIKKLIYDGKLFYNSFLEIGDKKFIDMPDTIKTSYKTFKTVEETEKNIFLMWLKDEITSREEKGNIKEEYAKYKELRKAKDILEARRKLREQLTHCKFCGERIPTKEQEYCEKCGSKLL